MSKKICLLLALCLVLAGCTAPESPEETLPSATSPISVATLPPETAQPTTEPALPPPVAREDFVRVLDYIPDIHVELKYATSDNFTGKTIYSFQDAFLRYGTVEKLQKVQAFLRKEGLSLKIWDAFRPVCAQFALWEACPDPNFVANPNTTFSSHSRGNTLDVTVVDKNGVELEMPTGFDDFSTLADRDYDDCPLIRAENARLLQSVMEQNGFTGYHKEWWHFTDTDSYDVDPDFSP